MWNPIWNRDEQRVRMVWRIILQLLVLALLTSIISAVGIGIGMVVFLVDGGRLSDLARPEILQQIMNTPAIQIGLLIASVIGIFGSVLFAGRFLDRRKAADFGFHFSRMWWRDFGFGLGLGAILMLLIFGVEWAAGWIEITGWMQPSYSLPFWVGIGFAILQFIVVGIQEEVFSRGYQLRNLAEGFNWRKIGPKAALLIGYFISSSVFGALHLGNPNTSLVSTINLIVAGLFLGLGFILTGELAIPIGLHITWNFFQGNVFGFPVSGTNAGATFIAVRQAGPDWMTGGAFGPEAGVIGLLAIALGCGLIVLWVRLSRGSLRLHERLAVFVPQPPKIQPVVPVEGEYETNRAA